MRDLITKLKNIVWKRPVRIWVVTIVLLAGLYWVTNQIVAIVTEPPLVMTTSPLAGGIAVSVEPAKFDEITSKVTYTGSATPYYEVSVYPRVEGWLEEIYVDEGDYVKKGQLIARLDRAELTARVQTIKGEIADARANLEFWTKEHYRIRELYENNAVSEYDFDNAKKELAAARAKLEALEAKLKAQETILGYTDIYAPISGAVARRLVDPGILVKPTTEMLVVADMSQMRVQVQAAEEDIPKVKVGTGAIVRIPALQNPHNVRPAKVTTIFPKLEPTTRTTTVELVVPNPGGLIKVDMYVIVDLILAQKKKALVIPRTAVVSVEGKDTVFTTDGFAALARAVKPGIAEGDRIEILEGIKEGAPVIYKGNRGLVDGQPVTIVKGL